MYRTLLGSTRLRVSAVGLGTSNWGIGVDEAGAESQLRSYLSAGGNLIDTADIYGLGASELIVGKLAAKLGVRDQLVLATKAGGAPGGPPLRPDLSGNHLRASLDESLRKLRTDYVDLWQLHDWDTQVPLAETLETADWAVSSGRVRYVGVCNYSGPQLAEAAAWQGSDYGLPIASAQVEYSLLDRGIERDLTEVAVARDIGIMAWGSLGRGVLTGKYRHGVPPERAASEFFQSYVGRFLDDRSAAIVEKVVSVADDLGCSPAAVAIAWVLSRPGVDVALAGASSADQLAGSLTGGSVTLADDATKLLDSVSDDAMTA